MLLLPISITSVLWALVSLCIIVGVIYLIFWVLGKLNIVIPPQIANIIWVILVLLALIWIINQFFLGGNWPGIDIRR